MMTKHTRKSLVTFQTARHCKIWGIICVISPHWSFASALSEAGVHLGIIQNSREKKTKKEEKKKESKKKFGLCLFHIATIFMAGHCRGKIDFDESDDFISALAFDKTLCLMACNATADFIIIQIPIYRCCSFNRYFFLRKEGQEKRNTIWKVKCEQNCP